MPTGPENGQQLQDNCIKPSAIQRSIYVQQQLKPEAPLFNLCESAHVDVPLDSAVLEQALRETVAAHEALRWTFVDQDGELKIITMENSEVSAAFTDVSHLSAEAQAEELQRLGLAEARRPFNLAEGPLIHCLAVLLGTRKTQIFVTVHHIIADGYSLMRVIMPELISRYHGTYIAGKSEGFHSGISAGATPDALRYWTQQFQGVHPCGELPTPSPRPARPGFRAGTCRVYLRGDEHRSVRGLAKRHDVTPFVLFSSLWALLIYRSTGNSEVVIGAPFTTRRHKTQRHQVGPLINLLPLRFQIGAKTRLHELLGRTRECVRSAQRHVNICLDELISTLHSPQGSAPISPFSTVVSYLHRPYSAFQDHNDVVELSRVYANSTRYDLELDIAKDIGTILLSCSYNEDLYQAADVDWILGTMVGWIRELNDDPDRPLSALPFDLPVSWQYASKENSHQTGESRPCTTATEKKLAGIWEEVLQDRDIRASDSFFDIGGHSLILTAVLVRIKEEFGVEISLAAAFQKSVLSELAGLIDAASPTPEEKAPEEVLSSAPLSFSQERIWFSSQMDMSGTVFNIPAMVSLNRAVNPELMEQAVTGILRQHNILRCRFVTVDGRPIQEMTSEVTARIPFEDIRGMWVNDQKKFVDQCAAELASLPFDLEKPPLFRLRLIQVRDDETLVLLSIHHLLADNWSLQLILRELLQRYSAPADQRAFRTVGQTANYLSYATAQRELVPPAASDLAFWHDYLRGAPKLLELPLDHSRPAIQTYSGKQISAVLPARVVHHLRQLATEEGTSSFSALLGIFYATLKQFTGQSDLVVGSPVTDRQAIGTESAIGTFVNILPIRTQLADSDNFRVILRSVRQQTLDAVEHRDVQFEQIVSHLNPERERSFTPLYQVMFDLHAASTDVPLIPDSHFDVTRIHPGTVQCDIVFTVIEDRDGCLILLQYNTDLFEEVSIRRFLTAYLRLAEQVYVDPTKPLSTLAVNSVPIAGAVVGYPETPLHELFFNQARQTPDKTALIADGRVVSFAQLEDRAIQIASFLVMRTRPGDAVGIALPRGIAAISAFLGIMKAGCVFVYLDPEQPREHLQFVIDDAEVSGILIGEVESAVAATQWKLFDVPATMDTDIVFPEVDFDAAACLIYTSGSTGQPKGVRCPHRGFANRLHWQWREFPFEDDEVCIHKTSLNFVDCIAEIFAPLGKGVPLVITPQHELADPAALITRMARQKVSRVVLVPSLLRVMLNIGQDLAEELQHLRLCVCSGETLAPELATRFHQALPSCRLLNIYGSTEVAADVTCHEVSPDEKYQSSVPIGTPIDNVQLQICHSSGALLPAGAIGELCVAGECLAIGYMKDQGDRFSAIFPDNRRIFRTGDLARLRPDGELELLGRIDEQVKARGVRINPSEVESALNQLAEIGESAVAVIDDSLVAFYLGASDVPPDTLRKELPLPRYMVPDRFVRVAEFPRTVSGKLDRQALSDAAQLPHPHRPTENDACSDFEQKLIELWQQYLNLPGIGRDEDFFELGGHSLIAAELLAAVENETGRRLPLATFLEAPTVADMARVLDDSSWNAPWGEIVTIQKGTCGHYPLFFFHGGFDVMAYHDLAHTLGPEHTVYGVQYPQSEADVQEVDSLEELVAGYLKEVQKVQPCGPYFLAGSSAAGIVAYEAARQLRATGQEVGLLAVFDTHTPGYPIVRSPIIYRLSHLWRRTEHHLGSLVMLQPSQRRSYLAEKHRRGLKEFKVMIFNALRSLRMPAPQTVPRWAIIFWKAMNKYELQPYDGHMLLFRADKSPLGIEPSRALGWDKLVKDLEIHEIPGYHGAIIALPRCTSLVAYLKPYFAGGD